MEPDIVEIYVNRKTKEILHFIPAAGILDSGEDLPEDAVFVTQINIDHAIIDSEETKVIMICPAAKECNLTERDGGPCMHSKEHEEDDTCSIPCAEGVSQCFTAEFTPVDDVGDEEEIS